MVKSTPTKKEGIFYAFFFVSALVILIIADFGTLTGPGIIAALLGLWFLLTGKYLFAAIIGIISAVSSFSGQVIVAYCPFCTLAAMCFLIGGMLSLTKVAGKYLKTTVILCGLTLLSVTIYVWNLPGYTDNRDPVIQSDIVTTTFSEEINNKKPMLYLSTTCPSCKDIMTDFVRFDSTGDKWQPIIVPHSTLARGEQILKQAGYKGSVISASKPPTNQVPVLEYNTKILIGKDIYSFLEMEERN